ncbi:pyroglutamyl-peptidase 1-like protein [Pleurodeles waltl]|uniref:pyroglutamyl-peptidase 1-like protein n=1 Tax=Pleurodeles waltl TaxID=8319 RepID=UPI0037096520
MADRFGPFRNYIVNSSWEAVKELAQLGISTNVDLHTLELPVLYSKCKQQVVKIWETLHPTLAVHVGLAPSAKAVILEQCGRNKGYADRDVAGFRPEEGCCVPQGPERIESVVHTRTVCRKTARSWADVIYSRDAGRYICDYAFYCSLYYGRGRAALVHMPPLTESLTARHLAKTLQMIINEMLNQCGVTDTSSRRIDLTKALPTAERDLAPPPDGDIFVIGYAVKAEFVGSGVQRARQMLNHQGNVLMIQPRPEA